MLILRQRERESVNNVFFFYKERVIAVAGYDPRERGRRELCFRLCKRVMAYRGATGAAKAGHTAYTDQFWTHFRSRKDERSCSFISKYFF